MTDIFISYAREDRERARTVANALQSRGWAVWWDRDVKAGQSFDQVIEHALETAKSVVVLWSKDSIASDWVKSEAAAAVQRGVLVPALIDNVKLPLEFSRRQTADLIGWEGDTSHAGFQALCDGVAVTAGTTPGSTPGASENPQTARDSWNQRRLLKSWWQRPPGILMASLALFAVLAALVAALSQLRTPKEDLTQTPRLSQSTQPGSRTQPDQPTNTATVVPSADRDKPTRLTSNEIRGLGVGEDIFHYYVFNAGPGTIRATVDGKNKRVALANAIGIELFDVDARSLLRINLGATTEDKREVGQVQLGRQQQVIMRVRLDEATIDYMVRLEGAVDLTQTPPLSQSTQPGSRRAQPDQPTNTATTIVPSTDRDKPTRLTSNEIRGLGVGEDIFHYYVFNAGPGTIRATVDGKNKRVALANAIGIELFDIDARSLLRINLGATTEDKREVGQVQLGRQQQVIMRVRLDEATIDYMVRLEGAVDLTQTPPLSQSTQPGSRRAQPDQPTNTATTIVPSADRDKPTRLTSNEIRGLGVGEHVSHYYVFNAGPGTIRAIVDGKNKRVALANAIGIELFDIDARSLLRINLGATTEDKREVGQVQLGRQQQVIMRVRLDEATIDYMVRLEGAVDFSPAQTPPK